MNERRTLRVAAVTGNLAWEYRQTCSGATFRRATAHTYIQEYTNANLARMEAAARDGARLVVGPEYFRGSELFLTTPENRRLLIEPPNGPTGQRMGEIARRHGVALSCAYDMEWPARPGQTGIVIAADGTLAAAQVKHPRCVPAPADWPFDTAPRVYDIGIARVGLTVCSDCTYNPELPLALARYGMEILLLPGCGFMRDMWRHFVVVRARDTQSVVIYADDGRAAIVNAAGIIVAETESPETIIQAEVELRPKKCSPDAE